MPNRNMKVSKAGIALIKEFEGLVLDAYQDSVGVWTIGYGHTKNVYPGLRISEAQAEAFLQEDIRTHAQGIFNYITIKLTQNQFDALASFHFNLGPNILEKSLLLNLINSRQFSAAAGEMKLYNQAGGQVLAGLVRRREAEAKLFLSNSTTTPSPNNPINSNDVIHTVVAGDSLWKISQQYGVTIASIVHLNNFASQNVIIHPGQKIIVKKKNATAPTPNPNPHPNPISGEKTEKHYAESGKFTANRSLAIRNEPKENAASVATLNNGEAIYYDSVYVTNKYIYISYISYSGVRRFVAIRTNINGKRGALWGTIV